MSVSRPVLIIGAASDIGRATARAYAQAGHPLTLAARDVSRLEPDATDLRLRYSVAVGLHEVDILAAASRQTLAEIEPLPSTAVCVVGVLGDQASASAEPVEAARVMLTNYVAPAQLLEVLANRMAASGGGTIVGISSVAGERGRGSNYTYGSAKAGFTAFLSGLRNRLAAKGVHVVTVKPGFVDTRMTQGMKLNPALTAQPEEVAAAILKADQNRRNVIYVRPIWRVIMAIIRAIPEPVFKKLKL